jgi:ABC-type phosphate/phosphonate transport system substrate-binding protein
MKFAASVFMILFTALWIVPQTRAASPAALSKVVVALKPDKDPDAMIAEREQLSKYLSDKLGRPVEVIVPLSAAVILEGLSNGTIDLAYLSATDMLNVISQQIATILLAGEIDGKTSYQSYWVTLKDKPYQSIADLKGKPPTVMNT